MGPHGAMLLYSVQYSFSAQNVHFFTERKLCIQMKVAVGLLCLALLAAGTAGLAVGLSRRGAFPREYCCQYSAPWAPSLFLHPIHFI